MRRAKMVARSKIHELGNQQATQMCEWLMRRVHEIRTNAKDLKECQHQMKKKLQRRRRKLSVDFFLDIALKLVRDEKAGLMHHRDSHIAMHIIPTSVMDFDQ